MAKNKDVIEVKFNSEKEKIFIFLKENTTLDAYEKLLDLFKLQEKAKIYLLPKNFVDSVKVIKDVKKNRTKKCRNRRS